MAQKELMNTENHCYYCGCPITAKEAEDFLDHCGESCLHEHMGYDPHEGYDQNDNDYENWMRNVYNDLYTYWRTVRPNW